MKQMLKSFRTILLAGLFLALLLPALAGTDNPVISEVSYLRFDDVATVSAHQADSNAELDDTTYGNESFFDIKHFIPFSMCSSAKAEEAPECLTIRIHWVGDEDKPEMRPQNNLYLYIKKDGGKSTQYATSAYTNWETQTTAPLKNADGSDCVYELDYSRKYDSLTERFHKAADRVKEIDAECARRKGQRRAIEAFRDAILANDEPVTVFSNELWNATIDRMAVNLDGSVKVAFRNGIEITV